MLFYNMDAEVYIDDTDLFHKNYDKRMKVVDITLQRLKNTGLKLDTLKYEWFTGKTGFLGYWITPKASKLFKKRVDT